jgi:hypothetical protein
MDLNRLDTLRSASAATASTSPEMWFKEASSVTEDPGKDVEIGTHPRMGIGLPLSNIFAT